MDILAWLRKQLAETEPDLLHEMVKSFAETLMGASGERASAERHSASARRSA